MIIKVEFDEKVWAEVLNMLVDQPYKRSGLIINSMAHQIQEQQSKETSKEVNESVRKDRAAFSAMKP
jgi:hypothetical protein